MVDPTTAIILVLLVAGIVVAIVLGRRSRRLAREQRAVQPRAAVDPNAPLNTLAVVTLILAFVAAIPALFVGHAALRQIDQRGERGRELAQAGLAISYVAITLVALLIPIAVFVVMQQP